MPPLSRFFYFFLPVGGRNRGLSGWVYIQGNRLWVGSRGMTADERPPALNEVSRADSTRRWNCTLHITVHLARFLPGSVKHSISVWPTFLLLFSFSYTSEQHNRWTVHGREIFWKCLNGWFQDQNTSLVKGGAGGQPGSQNVCQHEAEMKIKAPLYGKEFNDRLGPHYCWKIIKVNLAQCGTFKQKVKWRTIY